LNPIHPEGETFNASRIYLNEIQSAIKAERDFAFETTLSGRSYLALIKKLNASGWRVELVYLALPSVEYSHERVQERVIAGGHSIPSADIERRFSKSLRHLFNDFSPIVDRARCFLNQDEHFKLIFTETFEGRIITDEAYYSSLKQQIEQ
jgi:predicted ABC-type ATPase